MATSLVDYLKGSGRDSSVTSRAKLATEYGLVKTEAEYLSLASQGKNADINTKLLGSLQTKAPSPTPAPVPTTPTTNPNGPAGVSNFNNKTMTASEMEKGSSLPDPTTYASTQTVTPFSDRVSEVAKTTLSSNQLEIDKLRGEMQSMVEKEKATAQARKDKLTGQVEDFVGNTDAQDALEANNKKFKVEQNIKLYSDIQTKIVDAQQALEVGLIYEKDRPARMKFITGAESTLMKQGLATIGALQGTAAVIKGNLDLAKSFGDATVAAIAQDNEMSFKALTTLLELADNDLVNLTTREKELVDDRLGAIEEENSRMQQNKDDVLKLMTEYPRAFLAGGVTLLDSKEVALGKMIPQMAADETALFNASITKATDTKTDKDGPAEDKAQLLQLKNNGLTFQEAVDAFSDTLSVDWIRDVYSKPNPSNTSNEDIIKNQYYGQYLNEDGTIKTGNTVKLDEKGNPVVTPTEPEGESKWWNPLSWF